MSLFNFSGEEVSYNPLRGLLRELRAQAKKRGEEEEEEATEEEERIEAEREMTGKGISRMAGEELEERLARTRKARLGRGMSIMNQVSVVEQREANKCCCVCQ